MFDFSGDEVLCLIASGVVAVAGCIGLYRPIVLMSLLGRSSGRRFILAITPPVCLGVTLIPLCRWSDPQVAGHVDYIFLFLVVQAAFLAITSWALRLCSISIRDDVIDRDNPAALIVSIASLLGVAIIFSLSNVGGGPTIWTTIIPGLASALALLMLLFVAEIIGGKAADAITIERDIARSLRSAGMMLGSALILGRAAGGTWISDQQTWSDFLQFSWPAIVIAISAGLMNRVSRPSVRRPQPKIIASGLIPALIFVLAGFIALLLTPHGLHPSQW